jgi:hypothetical protein
VRTRLQQSLDVALPATMAFEHPTINALTAFLMQTLALGAAPAPAAVTASDMRVGATLDGVSDDDLARMLDAELNEAGF